jgi:tetratricopeptide (TPR) repeat protein
MDPGFSQAHIGLGLLDIRSGKYEDAIAHLEEATFRNPDCAEGWHLLGVARRGAGDLLGAEDAIAQSMRTAEGRDYSLQTFHDLEAERKDPGDLLPRGALPAHIRMEMSGMRPQLYGGNLSEAQALKAFIHRCRGDVELWLEEAFPCGLAVAVRILELALEHCPGAADYPMVHYAMARWYERLGHPELAEKSFARAAACPVDFCFPSRLEELPILARAVENDPSDWKARYLYGNLLASLDRGEEAMAQWRAALEIDDSFAVLHRNLAYGCLAWEDDAQASAQHYRDAIARNPQDYRYYLDLIRVLEEKLGASNGELLQVLTETPPEVRSKWQIAGREAELLVRLERFDEALALLTSHRYFPWEGAHHMRGLWVDCLTGRAGKRAESGDHKAALTDLELALTYPRNLGVGKRSRDSDARLYWLAAEQAGAVGNAERRSQLLEAAVAEPRGHNRDADWWQLLALRELGRTEEASTLEAELRAWAEEHRDHPRAGATAKMVLDRLAG